MPIYDDKNRAKATQRALKIARLFNELYFKDVMDSVDANDTAKFATTLTKAGLVKAEIDWLWNYLQHMNAPSKVDPKNKIWSDPPEAAAVTGW